MRASTLRLSIMCASALALLALASAHAQEPAGSVVVRDPVTGEMRAPTAAELRALRAAPAPGTAQTTPATAHPAAQPVVRPDGTRAVRLGDGGMVYTLATRDADGNLRQHCESAAAGQDAATGAPATPAHPPKEDRHDQR